MNFVWHSTQRFLRPTCSSVALIAVEQTGQRILIFGRPSLTAGRGSVQIHIWPRSGDQGPLIASENLLAEAKTFCIVRPVFAVDSESLPV